jgi:long-chain-fatty-acid--[acyl-carrier-protein] ligase
MKRWLHSIVMAFTRLLLHMRYRVEVRGLEKIRDLKGATMVLPNHQAYIDPPLILTHILLGQPLRPLVFSGTYRNPLLYPLMVIGDALEVPDLKQHSQESHSETLEIIDRVVDGLGRNEAFLLYPSGRLQRGNREVIGANRAAFEVTRSTDCNIVLVRTRGVWGSSYSCAETGTLPSVGRVLLSSFLWGFASLFLFAPRRRVTMTVELLNRNDLPLDNRKEFNQYLENWYNQGDIEEPVFVPFHAVLGSRTKEFRFAEAGVTADVEKVPHKLRREVTDMVAQHLRRPLTDDELQPQASLDTLGLDSLERMELSLELEQRYGFRAAEVPETLGQLWLSACGQLDGDEELKPAPKAWGQPMPSGKATVYGESIAEAFLQQARRSAKDIAVADELSGVLNYRRLLVGTIILARRFRTLEGDAVGLMLPASVAADTSFMALHLAGKTPVLLNWTTGPTALNHAVKTTKIKHVITSRRFIDRIGIEIEGVEFVCLEDVRETIGKIEKITTMLRAILAPGSFRAPSQDPDEPAAILFTSGSETAPKAVPLSHLNLLTNVREAIAALDFKRSDSLLGFLPPFHSFGLTGNLLFGVLAGVRLVHYPDPTNARGLVATIASYRPNLLVATPTFLGYILGVARDEDLKSLEIVISGAEKCPEAIRQECQQRLPKVAILEGYGITECSPIVSANRVNQNKPGTIGIPLSGVTTIIVHPETHQTLADGETGLLLVRGASIFAGYLNFDGPGPFVEHDGEMWYNTGDLVRRDEDGYLTFAGRLKRFIKSGGEMISLPALEGPFVTKFPPTEDGPRAAVEGIETERGGRFVVLFTTEDLSLVHANKMLSASGFRGVMRLDEVHRVDSIPLLGSGKVDYKSLRRHVEEHVVANESSQ